MIDLDTKTHHFFKILESLEISYQNYTHEPVFTVEESKHIDEMIPGAHCKSLLLTNKKEAYFLIVMLGEDRLDIKALSQALGKGPLSFVSAEKMKALIDLEPGHVTPFGVMADKENHVKVVLQKALTEYELINFHPLRNDMTTTIKTTDLLKFLRHYNHVPHIFEISLKKD